MIHRKQTNLVGATVLFQEGLKLRPTLVEISPEVSVEAQAINNSVEGLSMLQRINIRMKCAMFRAIFDVFGSDSAQRDGMAVAQKEVTVTAHGRFENIRHTFLQKISPLPQGRQVGTCDEVGL